MFDQLKPAFAVGAMILFLAAPTAAQQGMMQQGEGHMPPTGQMPMMQDGPRNDGKYHDGQHHDGTWYGHHHGDHSYGAGAHMQMMDPGMMHQGMMMHPGTMMQPGMMAPRLGWPLAVPRALTLEEVQEALERLLRQTNNPNIKLGLVEQADDESFRATVVTQEGSLVQTLSIDRFSGEMRQGG
ncbi:MAG: hypothetical protein P8X75_00580 [Limibacillus sp.]|jgi:hypothetical protein